MQLTSGYFATLTTFTVLSCSLCSEYSISCRSFPRYRHPQLLGVYFVESHQLSETGPIRFLQHQRYRLQASLTVVVFSKTTHPLCVETLQTVIHIYRIRRRHPNLFDICHREIITRTINLLLSSRSVPQLPLPLSPLPSPSQTSSPHLLFPFPLPLCNRPPYRTVLLCVGYSNCSATSFVLIGQVQVAEHCKFFAFPVKTSW